MMKRNFKTLITATLLAVATLSSCAGTNYKVSFSPYWLQDVYGDQTTVNETLVYDVSFKEGTPLNNYKLVYESGTYTTTLTSKMENGELLYEYETNLTVSGSISYQTNVHSFEDSVSSKVVFKSTEKSLAPVSSYKEYSCCTPRNSTVTAETDFSTWMEFGKVSTDYTTGKSTVTLYPDTDKKLERTSTIDYGKDKYTRLDNEQLWLGVRAVHQAANNTPRFAVYAPFTRQVQTVKATFQNLVTEDDFNFTVNGMPKTGEVSYFPVHLVLDQKDEGATQVLWIASSGSVQNNSLRNVVLRFESTVSYGIGTLIYQLKTATF